MTRINILLRKQLAVVRDLLDWVTEMEQALGSEQFQFDQKGRLHEHVVHHKILQQTIQSRHQEVESNTKDVLQFMKQCGSCISPEDVTKVRAGIEDLQIRSDVVLMQSYIRTNKLETALDVVKELDTSTDKIEVLQEKLEERMDALETNIGQDYATLTVQLDEHHRITEDINDQRLKCELIDKLGEAYQYQAKAYQDILADFRTAVLPHMSESNFRKSPEPDVIGTRIFSINSRMDRLKMSAVALGERLKALVSSHENYDQTVEGFNKWCGEVEGNLAALEKEAVATEPVSIMKQIDQVKNFNDGVVSHGRDLEWIKMTEAKLVDAQGALELEVNSNTNRSTTRYQAILVRIDDFFRRLKGALTNIPSFPGSLDALLRSIQQGHALIKQKLSTQLNAHQPTHPISELGKNDTQTKVRDTSLLSAVLANVSKNLKDLKDLLWTRSLAERNEDPSKSSGKECIPETVKKKRKLQDGNSFATLLIFLATVSLASASNQHQLTSGSPGNVTFDAPWTSRDGLFPYYTIRFESQRSPFCTMTRLHDGGFKSQQQYERFKVSYTLADDMIHVTVEISDVSEEDADVYTLTLTSFGDGSDSNTRVVKEIKICHPLGKAQCGILEAAEGYSKMYADVACRARVGNENSTLACYQHGTKIPYKGGIHNDGHHVHGRFWMKINKSPVYCCSHDYNTQTDQSTCNDFVWPRPTTSTTLNSLVTMPGQALSISTSNNAREFPGETYNSSCDLHAHISFLYLLLGISLYVVMQ
ncbi:uncharacterized protein [Diadema antillarum]|uniref:uncharacterized protein n=1 Tax=Diadema antillarum TaxID=105358 RepID=UPI003A856B5A